ncbi:MAG: hypothetical protein Q8L81_10895 [Bacteroidota bacterium]|nr:hypothetical protein [Bacteroidota bacterium]
MTAEKIDQKINVSMRIVDFIINEFFVSDNIPHKIVKAIDKGKVQYQFDVGLNADSMKKEITIFLKITFFAEPEKSNNLGHLTTTCIFSIANFEEMLVDSKVPNIVLASLLGINISSARGALKVLAVNTLLEDCLIPIINPASFFKQ